MLGVEQIRVKVGSTSYQRGVEYFESGAVAELQQRDSTVLAKCQGSRAEPYSLWAAIKSRNGKLLLGEAFCSCPVGNEGTCKHVVAMLLTWRESPLSQQLLARHHSDGGFQSSTSSSPFIARHHRISTAAVSLTPPAKRENNSFSKSRERHSMPSSFRLSESSNRQADKRRGNVIIALKDEDRTTLRCNALGITRYSSVSPIQRTSNKRKRVEFQKEEEAVGCFYEDDAESHDTFNEEEEEGESMERIPRPLKRRWPKIEESENDRWPSSSARSDLVAFLKGQNQKLKDTMAALEEQLESQIDINERLTKKLRKRESYIRRLEQHMDKLYARLGVSDHEPQKLKEEKMDVVNASRAQKEREIDEEEEEDTQGMDLTELVKLPSASSLTPSLFKDETPPPEDDKPTNAEQPQRELELAVNKEPTQTKEEEKQESENSDLFCNLFFFRPKSTPTTSNATISTNVNTTDSSTLASTSRSPSSPLPPTISSSSSVSPTSCSSSASLSSSSSSFSSFSSSFSSSSSSSSPSAAAAAAFSSSSSSSCSSSSSSSSFSSPFPSSSSSSPPSFSSSFPFFSLRTEDIGNKKHDEAEEQPTSHPTFPPPIKADDDRTVIIKTNQEPQQQDLPQRQERSLRELMEMHFSPQKDKQAASPSSSSSLAPTFHDIFFGGR